MATTISDLDGLFKEVYAPDIQKLMPEASKLIKLVPFSEEEKIGDKYEQPVVLTYPHGVTYAAPGAGAFSLNSAIAPKSKPARVDAYQHILRESMDYETAAKASSGGKKAFRKATELDVELMMESITKRVELDLLYGQTGVGVGDSSVNTDTTHTVVTLTTASWASGIWAGMENATIQFWKQSDNTLVSSSTDSIFTIDSVDVDNRKLTLSGTTTGISALDTALAAGDCDIYFNGSRTAASTFSQMAGLVKIITNTGSLFEISAATYNLWKGNTYGAAGALTLSKILSGLAQPCGRGLDEKVTVFLNDRTWANVASDQAALRKYDARYDEERAKNGFKALTLYSQNGEVELMPYNCIKEGMAIAVPLKQMKRIGSTDITWTLPGSSPENPRFFRELSDNAGFEYRVYSGQSIFCQKPARTLIITGIVNS